MGAINFSIDLDFINFLNKNLKLKNFVETGTYKGDSLMSVSTLFPKLYSCEIDESIHKENLIKFKNLPQISIFNSSAPIFLKEIKSQVNNDPTLFWLDAHLCTLEDLASSKLTQCHLIEELDALQSMNENSVILVDDARYFLSPPPKPYKFVDWPRLDTLFSKIKKNFPKHEIVIFNDTLVVFPYHIANEIYHYISSNTVDILTLADKGRDYDKLISQLKEKDLEIKDLKSECENRAEEIKDLKLESEKRSDQVFKKDQEIKDLKNECEKRAEEIKDLKSESEKRSDQIFKKDQEIKDLKSECEKRLSELHGKDKEIQFLTGECQLRLEKMHEKDIALHHFRLAQEKQLETIKKYEEQLNSFPFYLFKKLVKN